MKKLTKILLILLGTFPLILNAEEKEVKEFRWYTLKETNVHYENDVENNCEYFENVDKNTYKYGEWVYALTKPEEQEGRTIETLYDGIDVPMKNVYMINILYPYVNGDSLPVKEIEMLDKDMLPLKLKLVYSSLGNDEASKLIDNNYETEATLYNSMNLKLELPYISDYYDLTIKVVYDKNYDSFNGLSFSYYISEYEYLMTFANFETDITKTCEENICTALIKPKYNDYFSNENYHLNALKYRYKDKYYKCYTNEKVYVPGYFENLEGFIKDEDKFRITKTNTVKEELVKTTFVEEPKEDEVNELEDELTEDLTDNFPLVEEEPEEETKDKIAMVETKSTNKENNKVLTYISIFLTLSLIITVFLIIIKKVKNCRAK